MANFREVDKIAAALGISSSALFEEASSPANMKARFENQFSRTLEDALIARLEQTVRDVCKLM